MRPARLVQLVLCVLLNALPACVTVEPDDRTNRPRPTNPGAAGRTLDGPVAARVDAAATQNARVVVAVKPIGSVRFDGQQLPLISPDGRYLATQTGEAPTWDTLLAQQSQLVETRTDIAVYDLTVSPPRRLRSLDPLPPGAVLGRSADDAGFLIETVTPSGYRRIERVAWLSGERRPVSTASNAVAAHATLMPRNTAAGRPPIATAVWTRRNPNDATAALASPAGELRREAGLRFILPTAAARHDTVYAVAQRTTGEPESTLVALQLDDGAATAALRSAAIARVPLARSSNPAVAYQALTPLQTPLPPAINGITGLIPPGFVFFHPTRRRMVLLDPFTGGLTDLAENSSAAAWHASRDSNGRVRWGLFVTTTTGLAYQPLRIDTSANRSITTLDAAAALSESYVPRLTTNLDWPYLLIGPSDADPRALTILRMRTAPD
jgi:hypothetical protein